MAAGSRCSACPITSSASTGRRSFSKCSPSKASTAGRSSRPGTRCRSSCRAALTSHPSSRTASHTSSTRRRSPSPTQACAARLFWTGAPDVRTNAISPDTAAAGDARRRAGEAGTHHRLAARRDGRRHGQRGAQPLRQQLPGPGRPSRGRGGGEGSARSLGLRHGVGAVHLRHTRGTQRARVGAQRFTGVVWERGGASTWPLGKEVCVASGIYVSGRRELVAILRQRSRTYLFSNSFAPPIAAASLKVLELLRTAGDLRQRLADNTKLFRSRMAGEEFDILPGDHPIVPVMIGDAALAGRMAAAMLQKGVYVVGFSYPVVPQGKARIRAQVSAAHTRDDLERAVQAFVDTRHEVSR